VWHHGVVLYRDDQYRRYHSGPVFDEKGCSLCISVVPLQKHSAVAVNDIKMSPQHYTCISASHNECQINTVCISSGCCLLPLSVDCLLTSLMMLNAAIESSAAVQIWSAVGKMQPSSSNFKSHNLVAPSQRDLYYNGLRAQRTPVHRGNT
jgi:hypothetical protein